MFGYDATAVVGSIPIPTRVCTGHLDRLVVPEIACFFTEHAPHAQVGRLEPAGHVAVFERHDRLVSELSGLSDEVLAPGRPAEGTREEPGQRLHA